MSRVPSFLPRRVRPLVLASVVALAAGLPAWAGSLQLQAQGRDGRALADAVFMLEPLGAKPVVKPAPGVEIAQEGRMFVPLVTVVPVGTRISFPNRDKVRHHVYSFSDAKKFEIKIYAGKPEAPVEFDRAGVVVLGCNIHDTMVGWVVISDSPWVGKTAGNGILQLPDVPGGAYKLLAWHPDFPAGTPWLEQALTVGAAAQQLSLRVVAGGR